MNSVDRVFGMFGSNSKVEKEGSNGEESLNSSFGAARTPQYIISNGKEASIFASSMEKYPTYAPCLWFEMGSARLNTIDSSNHFTGDGRVVAKTTLVCMKYGSWGPELHKYLVLGTRLDQLIIKRIVTLRGSYVEVQATRFQTCYITTYEQRGDKIYFTFSFEKIIDAKLQYDNTGQKLGGAVGFEFDYTRAAENSTPDLGFMNEFDNDATDI